MNVRTLLFATLLSFLPPLSCGAEKPPEPVAPSVTEARRLLAEAGHPDGAGFPPVELLYSTSEAHKKIAAAIQSMWKRNLGVEAALRNVDAKTYFDLLSRLDYQVARRSWIGDYNDPNTFLEAFLSGGGSNNTGWSSRDYDSLLGRAAAEPDAARRRALLERAEALLMDDLPVLPVYFYVTMEMYRDHVKGWHQNPQAVHPLKGAHREDGRPLVINNHAEIRSLDPALARGVAEYRVQIGLYEGLTNCDPKTSEPVPGAAESWEVSGDGKTYTFHIRECSWSDGKPVTAQDFAYAWKRVLDPATAADYAHPLHCVRGARAFHAGREKDAGAVGIRAADDRTLVVELENPCAFFTSLTSFFTCFPVRGDVIEKHGSAWTRPENHVGNGPFTLAEWIANDHILLEKNARYWDAGKVPQKQIRFLPTEDASTAFNLYEKGECDIITTVPLSFIGKLRKRPDFHTTDYLGTYFYSFNVRRKPFDDKRVRRALALAIDREVIVEKITGAGEKAAYHFVPPLFPGFEHARLDRK